MNRREKKKRVRNHFVMNRPVLAMFLVLVLYFILSVAADLLFSGEKSPGISAENLSGMNPGAVMTTGSQVITIACSLLILCFFAFWFRGEYSFCSREGMFRKGFLLTSPLLVIVGLNLLGGSFVSWKEVPKALLFGIAPGLSEEILIRGVNIPNWMRLHGEHPKKIPAVVFFTSFIFAAAHLMNLLAGAGVGMTLLQVGYAFGIGALFASAYLRTGSLVWPVIMHSLIDFTAFLHRDIFDNAGVLGTEELALDWSLILLALETAALITLAFYYIRPAKREEIAAVWKEKWKKIKETVPVTEGSAEGFTEETKMQGEEKYDGE